MRCALYARYSSDLQRAESIEDQLRLCQARAAREGWQVTETFADAALSGTSMLRPGYQALLDAIRNRRVDVVLSESLDRISRDQEHIAAFYKQATFAGVPIVTLAEGEVSELHIGLKGTMGALYLKDLGDKTRRGLAGVARAGRIGGTVSYGYRAVRRLDDRGEPVRGRWEIDPGQAEVVRRIFRDYAAGISPFQIARALNAEGIPGPRGPWYDSTIRGRRCDSHGMLEREIYAGRHVWNRRRKIKDPLSGVRVARENPADAVVVTEVPELRIIEEDVWQAVQQRLAAERAPRRTSPEGQVRSAFWTRRRPLHLLTGKVVCGVCGGGFKPVGKDYLGCKAARSHGCSNWVRVRRPQLQARVLAALERQLMPPDLLAEFVRAFTAEWNRLTREQGAAALRQQRELQAVERKLDNLIEAIANGLKGTGLQQKLDELEAQRSALTAALAEAPPPTPALHPNLGEVYRRKVANLEAALARGQDPEALEAARALIERVVIHPPSQPDDAPSIELAGDLASLLAVAGAGPTSAAGANTSRAVLAAFTGSAQAQPSRRMPAPGA